VIPDSFKMKIRKYLARHRMCVRVCTFTVRVSSPRKI
jgi:hypothetical protein